MKKLFTLIAATILCVGAQAQTVNIHLKNGSSVCYSGNQVEYVDFDEEMNLDSLGVERFEFAIIGNLKWARANMGAANPWEPGKYYRFGQKQGYTLDDVANDSKIEFFEKDWTPHVDGSWSNSNYPTGMPSGFRVPSVADFNSLIASTTQRWGTCDNYRTNTQYWYSSMSGMWFIATNKSDSIFIPAVSLMHEGVMATSEHYDGAEGHGGGHFGCYWTSDSKDKNNGCGFFFGSEEPVFEQRINTNNDITNRIENTELKWFALPVRPCANK